MGGRCRPLSTGATPALLQSHALTVDQADRRSTLTDQLNPGETPVDRELAELLKGADV